MSIQKSELESKLQAAINRPKQKAPQSLKDQLGRFMDASLIGRGLMNFFLKEPSAASISVIHPTERDEVKHKMEVALEKIRNAEAARKQQKKDRQINYFAKLAARNKKV